MPQLQNAKKALRKSRKRAERSKVKREELHSLRRNFRKLLEAGKLEEAKALTKTLDKKVDKAAKNNLIKGNKAARIKSRYMLKLNEALSGEKAKAEATE